MCKDSSMLLLLRVSLFLRLSGACLPSQEALHDQHELRSLERITLLYSASTADEMAYRCQNKVSKGYP